MEAHELEVIPLHPAPHQGIAVISRIEGIAWWCHDGRNEYRAERAASCLLEPEVGDRVWTVGEPGQGHYVLAVLQRASNDPAALSVDGDATLAATGRLTLTAGQDVHVESGRALTMTADEVGLQARTGRMVLDRCSVVVQSMFASMTKTKLVGRWFESAYERVIQRAERSYRSITQVDHVRSADIDYRADNNAHIRAKNALVTAEKLVKLDGDQVHLG
ncbi:MAG: DUF3540 domain-containing protein [Deltaproteobacteria bacterium]|nr:DUF3540 domain-containing protein [Deltaproteobacteria bacterium]